MADGRDLGVWNNHARECRDANRVPFEYYKNEDVSKLTWLEQQVLGLSEVQTVLDLGCGPGYWRNLFIAAGKTYTGFDQSPDMLALAKELSPAAEFIQGNGRGLVDVLGERKFDLVFTSAVLQHNRHEPDKSEIVRGMYYVLKDGGYYLCTEDTFRADNRPDSVDNPYFTNGYSFTSEGWRKWMSERGFEMLGFNGRSEYLYRKV